MKKYILILFITVTSVCFLLPREDESVVNVAAASNTGFALKEIKDAFIKENPSAAVNIILGSSGKLTSQILNGAEYNVFLSADMHYPEKIWIEGFSWFKPKVYAQGELIFFSNGKLKLSEGLSVLNNTKINHIAVANSKLAPYGKAALEVIEKMELDNLNSKLLICENISQVAEYALLAADGGFLAKSILFSPEMKNYNNEGKYWISVDSTLYNPIEQGIVLIKKPSGNEAAAKFYEFIFSDAAGSIFKKYGYHLK